MAAWRDDLRFELLAVVAMARKNMRVRARYKVNTMTEALGPLYQFLLPSLLLGSTFVVAGRASGFLHTAGTADVAGFMFLGAAAGTFAFGAFWGVGFQLRVEMMQGTLEPLWLAPCRRHVLVLGNALADFTVSCATGVLLLAIGGLFFGAHYLVALVAALPALLLASVALVGIAFLVASMVLLVRESNFLVDTLSFLFSMASGTAFPLTMLPGVVAVIPFFLPTTYALDVLRTDALHTRPLLPVGLEYALLSLLIVVLVPFGAWVFARTERRLRRLGTVGMH